MAGRAPRGRLLRGRQPGTLFGGIAAVANVGDDRNWCGHPFAQANWYAFGRLAWDDSLSADEIADEWLRMTFAPNVDERFVAPVKEMMLSSREAVVDYMTPLGLHHIMAEGHHHGPGPWVDVKDAGRADWTSVYYHRADADGIGFDRTAKGSDAVSSIVRRCARSSPTPPPVPSPCCSGSTTCPGTTASRHRAARCGTSSVTATTAA